MGAEELRNGGVSRTLKMAVEERFGHRLGDLGLSQDEICPIFSYFRFHDLLLGDRVGASLFRLSPRHADVRFRLVGPRRS